MDGPRMRPRAKNGQRDTMVDDIPSSNVPDVVSRSSLLRVHEAAERLVCSISTIRRLVAEQKLPAYRVGRGIRIAEADLECVLRPVR